MATFTPKDLLGVGGFGEVWRGTREEDGMPVAIKYLRDTDEGSEDRFRREVRCLENLSHPGIVKVLGKQLVTSPLYYVMPLYRGSLAGQFPAIVRNHLRIRTTFSAVLEAVAFAHAEGIIHRDLKPENILINSDSEVVVNDFGLGRMLNAQSTRLTQTGQFFGTILYCAPEQLEDAKRADPRSDIYSLGRILYDFYAGIHLGAHDLTNVPFPIASIVQRACHRDPARRYQSVGELLSDFQSTMEMLLGEIDTDSLEGLLESLKDPSKYGASLEAIIRLLPKYAEDGDIVHSSLMKLPPGAFLQIENSSSPLARQLSITFASFVTAQSWGFSYTDTIGSVASRLFTESRDPISRSYFTETVLLVGVGHNRWSVMETSALMIQSISDDENAQQHWTLLRSHESELEAIRGYIKRNRLHPILRGLFSETG